MDLTLILIVAVVTGGTAVIGAAMNVVSAARYGRASRTGLRMAMIGGALTALSIAVAGVLVGLTTGSPAPAIGAILPAAGGVLLLRMILRSDRPPS